MPKPALDIYYYPMLTVKADGSTRAPQVVACFGIPFDGPTACFAQLAKVVWLAALQCRFSTVTLARNSQITLDMLGQPFPEDPSHAVTLNGRTFVNDALGLRESLRLTKTLARGLTDKPLDFDRLTTLLQLNFESRLRRIGGASFRTVYFPPIPGLIIRAPEASYNYNFWTQNPRTTVFEDRLQSYMQGLRLQATNGDPLSRSGSSRGNVAFGFAVLTFEQYFDRLVTLVNNMYYQSLSDLGGTAELGLLLDAGTFRDVAGALSNDFSSGLRLPESFSAGTPSVPTGNINCFYEWTGQQFPATGFDPSDAHSTFRIAFERYSGKPPTWLQIVTGDEPNTVEVDGPLIAGLAATTPPLNIRDVQPLNPLRGGPRRFSFSPPQRWVHAGVSTSSIAELPGALRREISQLADEIGGTDAFDKIKLQLFTEEAAGNLETLGPDPTTPVADYRWATVIPLRIRRVLDTTVDGGNSGAQPIAAIYELVGMSERDRRLLDQVLIDYPAAPPELYLLYANMGTPPEPSFRSDALDASADACQCVVFRTNLTTESAPFDPTPTLAVRAVAAERDVAAFGEQQDFLRLVQQACIVNSGGYFLHYSPTHGSDPLNHVFDSADGKPVFVTLLIRFSTVESSPHPRPYYTAVVGPPLSVTATATRYIYAHVMRQSLHTGSFYPLQQYDPCLPQGAVGFSAVRDALTDPGPHANPTTAADQLAQARFYLDRMFNRLSYQVAPLPNATFRQFPLTLPVAPLDSALGSPTEWKWKHAVQVLIRPFEEPYAGIGQVVDFAFGFRDIFGNELPATGSHVGLSVRMRYYDPLISLTQWPGLRTEFDVDTSGLQLIVRLQANPYQAEDNGSGHVVYGLDSQQRWQVCQVYQNILAQLRDPLVGAFLEIKTPGGSSPRPISCLTTLINFILQIPNPQDFPDPDPVLDRNYIYGHIDLHQPTFDAPADFFPLTVQVRVERITTDEDLFWKVVDPWEDGASPTPHIHEPTRRVVSPIGLPGALGGNDQPPGLEIFARNFETLYSTAGLKVATCDESLGLIGIWLLRMNALRPTLRRPPASAEGVPLVFAPRPLSNQLLWAKLPEVPPPAPDETPLIEQLVSNVDFDIKSRDFLTVIERFLEPPTVSAILCLGESTVEPQFGRIRFQKIMTAKRQLSQSLPKLLVDILYLNGPMPGTCAETTARTAFRQHMLTTLNAAYGIDLILQFNAIPSPELSADRIGGGIALIGKVAEVPLSGVLRSTPLNFRNDKIRFRSDRTLYPPRLTVLVDQPPQALELPQERPLKFVWTHIEHIVETDTLQCGLNVDYRKSRWLTLVIPDELLIHSGENITFPIPLREHPRPPRLVSHMGAGDSSTSQLDLAIKWRYESNFETAMESQDELDFEVELNGSESRLSFTATPASVPEDLFHEMMYFHSAFPSPDEAFAAMRNVGGAEYLKIFADRIEDVSKRFDAWASRSVVASAPPLSLKFRLRDYSESGRRRCDLVQIDPQPGVTGVVTPTYATGIVDPLVNIPSGFRVIFDGDVLQGSEGWRGRLLQVFGLNVLRSETALSRGQITRNRILRARGETVSENFFLVNSQYVYRTVWAEHPLPAVPYVVNDTPIDISSGATASLSNHLRQLFNALFGDVLPPDPLAPSRRLRLETRYAYYATPQSDPASDMGSSWQARVPILSPQRLLPAQEVRLDDLDELIEKIVTNLSEWEDQFDPAKSGSIIWDMLIYSALSLADIDKPLLRLSHLELPLNQISSWD